jgi:two-component system chemotaxis response regulator CheY
VPSILLCDDSLFARHMTRRVLAASFAVVGEAEDGEEAVSRYRDLKPDVLLIDLVMPRMSGTEAIRRIVAEFPEACIVVCSAMGQEALVDDALAAGARGFVIKPVKPEALFGVLEEALA